MNIKTEHEGRPSREWLLKMAEGEDRCESVAVGGMAEDVGLLRTPSIEPSKVFGRFIEFARRAKGMSVEQLAAKSDVDLSEIVSIEREESRTPASTRTVYQLAETLDLPSGKLMELAGLVEARNQEILGEAALRFAARSEPTGKLSKGERAAFEEFVKVLIESSATG